MSAETLLTTPPVRIVTYWGDGVEGLAEEIVNAASDELKAVGAWKDTIVEAPTPDAEQLQRAITAPEPLTVLQIISHASTTGRVLFNYPKMPDEGGWRQVGVGGQTIARMLDGRGVRVALVLTCFGDQIAKAVTESGVVDMAIGTDRPFEMGTAFAFPQGFYRSLALGRSLREAAEDGIAWARPRMEGWKGTLQPFFRDGADESPLFRPPVFHVIGDDHDAVEALITALSPHRVFHIDRAAFGTLREAEIDASLAVARVVMVLFKGHRVEDAELLEQVKTAVDQARLRGRRVRLFPLYLEGTTPSPLVPYGLRRLTPAYLHGRGIDGDYDKLAARLTPLI